MRLARVFLIAICAATAQPFTLPTSPLGRVNDHAGLLSADARSRIEASLASYDERTSTEIVIVTFKSLEGESLEDVSMRLAEKWKIGKSKKDNGVILVFSVAERSVRIEVGYGLEGTITDAVSSSIIRTAIVPKFRTGDFDGGMMDGVEAIMKAAEGEYTAEGGTDDVSSLLNDPKVRMIVLIVLAVIVFLFIIDLVRFMTYKRSQSGNSGRYGLLEWFLLFSALLFFIKLVLQIAYYALLARGGGGGRGFSGGGGSFGGGGASGKW
ncbi:MAG: TPM domain-containing protein [Spirochaetota bacterium]